MTNTSSIFTTMPVESIRAVQHGSKVVAPYETGSPSPFAAVFAEVTATVSSFPESFSLERTAKRAIFTAEEQTNDDPIENMQSSGLFLPLTVQLPVQQSLPNTAVNITDGFPGSAHLTQSHAHTGQMQNDSEKRLQATDLLSTSKAVSDLPKVDSSLRNVTAVTQQTDTAIITGAVTAGSKLFTLSTQTPNLHKQPEGALLPPSVSFSKNNNGLSPIVTNGKISMPNPALIPVETNPVFHVSRVIPLADLLTGASPTAGRFAAAGISQIPLEIKNYPVAQRYTPEASKVEKLRSENTEKILLPMPASTNPLAIREVQALPGNGSMSSLTVTNPVSDRVGDAPISADYSTARKIQAVLSHASLNSLAVMDSVSVSDRVADEPMRQVVTQSAQHELAGNTHSQAIKDNLSTDPFVSRPVWNPVRVAETKIPEGSREIILADRFPQNRNTHHPAVAMADIRNTSPIARTNPSDSGLLPEQSNAIVEPKTTLTPRYIKPLSGTFLSSGTTADNNGVGDVTSASASVNFPLSATTGPVDIAPLPNPQTTTFHEELGNRLGWLAERQITHAEIRVTPENLGTIEVHLQIHGGEVQIDFGSPHAEVRAAIEAGLPRLREAFLSQGMNLTNVDISGNGTQQSKPQTPLDTPPPNRDSSHSESVPETEIVNPVQRGLLDEYA